MALYLGDKMPDKKVLRDKMRSNNPKNEPVGPYTGRCDACGSKDLWDDNLHYGCKDCGALLG